MINPMSHSITTIALEHAKEQYEEFGRCAHPDIAQEPYYVVGESGGTDLSYTTWLCAVCNKTEEEIEREQARAEYKRLIGQLV